jgi:menaquinone-dependent protoporphyrinogen oxidase
MAATVLVAFATKHGSTKAIAQAVGSKLHSAGLRVRVLPASVVRDLSDYDAVVVGSAIYHNQWLWDGFRFVRRLKGQLRERPVWLFSSGPIGGTPSQDALVRARCGVDTPVPDTLVPSLRNLNYCGHATFGGRVDDRAAGIFERYVPHGDWRDFDQVRAWARGIGSHPAVAAATRDRAAN